MTEKTINNAYLDIFTRAHIPSLVEFFAAQVNASAKCLLAVFEESCTMLQRRLLFVLHTFGRYERYSKSFVLILILIATTVRKQENLEPLTKVPMQVFAIVTNNLPLVRREIAVKDILLYNAAVS